MIKLNQKRIIILMCLFITGIYFNGAFAQSLKVTALRTEYMVNPLGIDVTAPRLSWKIISPARNIMQTAYEIKAANSPEDLKLGKSIIWDTKKVISEQSVNIEYSSLKLQSGQRVYWAVRVYDNKNQVSQWSELAYWEMGLLKQSDWKADWIVPDFNEDTAHSLPCPMLRKEFSLAKKIKQARLYVSSHGLYLMDINGSRVNDWLFNPGWTSYNKRLQYQVYDVTAQLNTGTNAIGVTLGDGWYRGFLAFEKNRNSWGKKLGLILQLEIIYDDNTKELITSNETWKANTGPILKSDIYNGETYDARLEKPNWSATGYNDKDWKSVIKLPVSDYNLQTLVATVGPPVRRIQEIQPVKIFKTPKGETVADMGQNMVGWVRMDVTGKAGTAVTLKFAEVLDKKGNMYYENLRTANSTDVYTLKGGGKETFEPHFTFHGFRYVALNFKTTNVQSYNLTGIVIHSDMTPSGSFKCSDSLVNILQHNIVWGLKGNFINVPTDCPQRDERLGWTGDAQVFTPTACFNMDAASFYTKWLKDVRADQLKSGAIPHVIPDMLHQGGSTGWSDVDVVIPWSIYLAYGDTRILKDQYESMQAWIEFMRKNAGDTSLWRNGRHFGDWLAFSTTRSDYPGATTDKDLIATAYFAYSTSLLAKAAAILGKKDDAVKYEELVKKIKAAFQNEYVSPNGRLSSNTQTAYVLALAFGLIPPSLEQNAADRLAKDVKKFKHITTGFLGTPLICQVLTKYGHEDLAYMLLLNKKYPSWLYPITMGATTIWERWDGIKPDSTFQDPDMNSFNHYAYGAIGNWLYSTVAGIQISPDAPGYKKIIINPHLGGKLTFADAEYESVYGKIKSGWNISDKEFKINITVPPNTTAEVHIPSAIIDNIKENNKPVKTVSDIKFVESKNGQSVFIIGSGDYSFSTKLSN